MTKASGFHWMARKDGSVVITHHGKHATTLRSGKAAAFLDDMDAFDTDEQQDEMARLTGNYRRGNERLAKRHPRNG